jgi:Ca2+-transporting ATPase
MGQLFNVVNARSDDRSAFHALFRNGWLWAAILSSLVLHAGVVYIPVLQRAFTTTNLDLRDWLVCAAAASLVLWCREFSKLAGRLWSSQP